MKNGFIGVIVAVLIGFFLLGALGTLLGIITLPWFKLDTQVQTNRDIITKTYDADNVIYNYEWFKSRLEEIKATEAKTENAIAAQRQFEQGAGPRKDWTFEDKNESARLNSVVLGLNNHYQDLVAEYNARAKMANRNIFEEDLPLFFTLKPF